MKALLYKDMMLFWRNEKYYLLVVPIFCFVAPTSSYTLYFIALVIIIGSVNLLSSDEKCGWEQLAMMLPYSTRSLVLSKYIVFWFLLLYSLLFYAAALLLVAKITVPEALVYLLLTAVTTLAAQGVCLPVLFTNGAESGTTAVALIAGLLIATGTATLSFIDLKNSSLLLPLFLALLGSMGVNLGSVVISSQQYAKRLRRHPNPTPLPLRPKKSS